MMRTGEHNMPTGARQAKSLQGNVIISSQHRQADRLRNSFSSSGLYYPASFNMIR